MSKFAITQERIGNRVTGYMLYNSKTKDFTGYTEKQIKQIIASGENVKGLIVNEQNKLLLDKEHFHTYNIITRSGINKLSPLNENGSVSNVFYVVVGANLKAKPNTFEVISSKFGRTKITEQKLHIYLEIGAISGGAYLDSKGKIIICDGIIKTGNEVKK